MHLNQSLKVGSLLSNISGEHGLQATKQNPLSKSVVRNYAVSLTPINLNDLIDETPADETDFVKAEAIIMGNFGLDNLNEVRNNLIWKKVLSEKWSRSRFWDVFDDFISTVRFPSFTVAEFWSHANHSVLYGPKWLDSEIRKDPDCKSRMDVYEFNGTFLYRYHDGRTFQKPGLRMVQINGESITYKRAELQKQLQAVYSEGCRLKDILDDAVSITSSKPITLRNRYRTEMNMSPTRHKMRFKDWVNREYDVINTYPAMIDHKRVIYMQLRNELEQTSKYEQI